MGYGVINNGPDGDPQRVAVDAYLPPNSPWQRTQLPMLSAEVVDRNKRQQKEKNMSNRNTSTIPVVIGVLTIAGVLAISAFLGGPLLGEAANPHFS